jgi:hypothetical protein
MTRQVIASTGSAVMMAVRATSGTVLSLGASHSRAAVTSGQTPDAQPDAQPGEQCHLGPWRREVGGEVEPGLHAGQLVSSGIDSERVQSGDQRMALQRCFP